MFDILKLDGTHLKFKQNKERCLFLHTLREIKLWLAKTWRLALILGNYHRVLQTANLAKN